MVVVVVVVTVAVAVAVAVAVVVVVVVVVVVRWCLLTRLACLNRIAREPWILMQLVPLQIERRK